MCFEKIGVRWDGEKCFIYRDTGNGREKCNREACILSRPGGRESFLQPVTLDNKDDFVRLEISTALKRGIRVNQSSQRNRRDRSDVGGFESSVPNEDSAVVVSIGKKTS